MGKQEKANTGTYQIVLTDNALGNIDEITGYIAFINHEPMNAIKVGDAIMAAIEKIGRSPLVYRECEELKTKSKMYRRAICLSWIIIYKVIDFEITILGIIHSARRPHSIKKLRKLK
ncbi:MAG: hypothetical protein K0Q79_3339 [Flavipsychrobacter sp.]|jgi:plasmid stabilization system protein ParE|nr:hypothetical protein [Flavipsychrobacter sp.]